MARLASGSLGIVDQVPGVSEWASWLASGGRASFYAQWMASINVVWWSSGCGVHVSGVVGARLASKSAAESVQKGLGRKRGGALQGSVVPGCMRG